ncbi:hypothetical protein LSCM1_02304 [Leishmania martiniquensis]|uniref:Cytosolic carboxypeptidase-like protein 5 n=1 Tax=Leishmania martiniquensis TaxID=1580590 RepID=A0A836GA51_9TRYP|nr:hypothetical protein LSCM1_02304 [Leishmania martiniquensis]
MPRSSSLNNTKLSGRDALLEASECTQPAQQQSLKEREYQANSTRSCTAAEEEADLQGLTNEAREETGGALGLHFYKDLTTYPPDVPVLRAAAAFPRWRQGAPNSDIAPTTGGDGRDVSALREDGLAPSPPLEHRPLSRSLLFSTTPKPRDVAAPARSSSTHRGSAEQNTVARHQTHRLPLEGRDCSPKGAAYFAQQLHSGLRESSIEPLSSPGRTQALPIRSSRCGIPATCRTPSLPASRSSQLLPSALQHVALQSCALTPAPPEAVGSVVSNLDIIRTGNLVTEPRTSTPNRSTLQPPSSSHPLQSRQQQLHQKSSIQTVVFSSLDNEANATRMGQSFSGCSRKTSPKEGNSQRTSTEGRCHASRRTSKSTNVSSTRESAHLVGRRDPGVAAHLASGSPANASGPMPQGSLVDDGNWVFQRPPNNQRTFYFEEDNLEFSSQFDSGNLIQVERLGTFQYRMYTAMDCGNSPWQTNNRQWFHFSVRGGIKGATVTICFVGMAHSSMFTYEWMPVMAVVPTRPHYTRIPGKALVEALETMPETPGYPLLVHKPVPKDDADSDGGDEGYNEGDLGGTGTAAGAGSGSVSLSVSPAGKPSGAGKSKKNKKKNIAMNLTFHFKIEAEISVTYTPPQGRPDAPAIYIASNHPYTYYTLQRNLTMWQEVARRSISMRETSVQGRDHQAMRFVSEQRDTTESHGKNGPITLPPEGISRDKKSVASSNSEGVPVSSAAAQREIYFHREVLCKSLEKRDVTLLTISDCSRMTGQRAPLISKDDDLPHSSALGHTQRPYSFSGKHYVVLTARVHPGECPGSHLMHGCIDFLLNCTDSRAAALRHNFVFCIVPMLNPDGVIRGHSRVDSNGVDLNRMYRDPSRKRHPAPFAVLALLRSLGSQLALFIDMHAHANKRGTFFYGNSMDGANQVENLLYAKLVSLNTPYLDFRSCNFSEANMFAVGKSGKRKDSSSRVVAFTEAGIVHGYTIETSHVMADTLNQVALLTSHSGDQLDTALPTPLPLMHTVATFHDTGRAMLVALLDLKGLNPVSRLPLTQFHSTRGLALWLQRQLQIESAELLFAQAFKMHGKEVQVSTSESGSALLTAIMKSMTTEEYPDKITIKGARLLPRTTFSGVRTFLPPEMAILLLLQTAPTGPPRSLLYSGGNSASVSGGVYGGGANGKGGDTALRRGLSPSYGGHSGNSGVTTGPPPVISTRRRSKPAFLSGDSTVET